MLSGEAASAISGAGEKSSNCSQQPLPRQGVFCILATHGARTMNVPGTTTCPRGGRQRLSCSVRRSAEADGMAASK
jgi:hypothetical protein